MPGHLEAALRRERSLVAGTLVFLVLVSAIYTVAGVGMEMSAISMTFGGMSGMGLEAMGSMTVMPAAAGAWSTAKFVMMFLMWWLMMIAMMLSSAAPTVLLHATVLKRSRPEASTQWSAFIFTSGYLSAWAGFSLAVTAAQQGLEVWGLVSPSMMMLVSGPAGALVAMAAGAYQFTPLKDRCLTVCRAPAEFIARHHRPGALGTLRLGALHGAFCLGCCIALMALLFVGGVMNLIWIVGLAGFVALEKLGSRGHLAARIAGAALIAFGILRLAQG